MVYSPVDPLRAARPRELISCYDGIFMDLDLRDAFVLEAADRLLVVSRHGIVVTNTPDLNRIAGVKLTIGLQPGLVRGIPLAVDKAQRGVSERLQGREPDVKGRGPDGEKIEACQVIR